MKIEMGESLLYSWLRHVKDCQIVQLNWKVSNCWKLQHEEELNILFHATEELFDTKYGYKIFKQNSSMSQIIQQGECDAIGVSIQNGMNRFYAVDVAFHEAGLNYGSKIATIMKVILKSIRTAMIIYGYMGSKEAEIIFASPKITHSILNDLEPCIRDLNEDFRKLGYDFTMHIIANEEFNESVLQPILSLSDDVADTSELFLRSYQMFSMFSEGNTRPAKSK